MKIKIAAIAFFCISIISCRKDYYSKNNQDLQQYNISLKANTKDLGSNHNDGISHSLNSNPLIIDFIFPDKSNDNTLPPLTVSEQDIKSIILSTYDFVGSIYGNDSKGISENIKPAIVDIINASNSIVVNNKLDSIKNTLIQNNILTSREASMMQEIQNIFTVADQLNMTSSQAGPYFENKLNELKIKYQNIIWNINEGEAFLGMLSIAESSNKYWHSDAVISINKNKSYRKIAANPSKRMNNVTVPALDPLEPEGSIVHIDLAGYALAWGWAVYNDWSSGNLTESGQYNRMTKGLQGAITASTMRRVTLKWGQEVHEDFFPDLTPGNGNQTPETSLNFPSDYSGLYYYVSSKELAHNDNLVYPTYVYLGQSNKYYYNPGLTCLLPDGIYFSKLSTSYYKVINGLVKEKGVKPKTFPGGVRPIQHIIDDLFPACN